MPAIVPCPVRQSVDVPVSILVLIGSLPHQPAGPGPHSIRRVAPTGYADADTGRARGDDIFEAVDDEIPIVDEDDDVQDSDDDIVDDDNDDRKQQAQEDDLTLLEARSYGKKTPKEREERRADIQVFASRAASV